MANALSRMGKLASITTPKFILGDRIKEEIENDQQAKSLMDLARQGKSCQFWLQGGLLKKNTIKSMSLSGRNATILSGQDTQGYNGHWHLCSMNTIGPK